MRFTFSNAILAAALIGFAANNASAHPVAVGHSSQLQVRAGIGRPFKRPNEEGGTPPPSKIPKPGDSDTSVGGSGPVSGRPFGAGGSSSKPDEPAAPKTQTEVETERGQKNIDRLAASSSSRQGVDEVESKAKYDATFNAYYDSRVGPPPAGAFDDVDLFPEEHLTFLKNHGIDLRAPGTQKIEVWGSKDIAAKYKDPAPQQGDRPEPSRSDSEDDDDESESDSGSSGAREETVWEGYANPDQGWIYRTREFNSADYNRLYDAGLSDPAARIRSSEHMYRQWKVVAGDKPLRTIGVGQIDNFADETAKTGGTSGMLKDLSDSAELPEGTITNDAPEWTRAMGTPSGYVGAHSLADHPSDVSYNGQQPTSADWRFGPTGFNGYNDDGDKDAYMVFHLEQPAAVEE